MKPSDFLNQIDDARVVAAIREVEERTSGEIRVWVTHRHRDGVLGWARRRFDLLGMNRTRDRNAVLIYIAPKTRQFAIVGDAGVHEKCGEEFWQQACATLSADMRDGPLTVALENAVRRAGDLLAQHFPPRGDDRNELPDAVGRD